MGRSGAHSTRRSDKFFVSMAFSFVYSVDSSVVIFWSVLVFHIFIYLTYTLAKT